MWLYLVTQILAMLVLAVAIGKRLYYANLQIREQMDADLQADMWLRNTHYAGRCLLTGPNTWAFVAKDEEVEHDPTLLRMRMGVFDPPMKTTATVVDCHMHKDPNDNRIVLTSPNAYPADTKLNVTPEIRAYYAYLTSVQDQIHMAIACVYLGLALAMAMQRLVGPYPKKTSPPAQSPPTVHAAKPAKPVQEQRAASPPPISFNEDNGAGVTERYAPTPNLTSPLDNVI